MNGQQVNLIFQVLDRSTQPLRRIAQGMSRLSQQTKRNMREAGQAVSRLGATIGAASGGIIFKATQISAGLDEALAPLKSIGMPDLSGVRKAGQEVQKLYSGLKATQVAQAARTVKSGIDTLNDLNVAKFAKEAAILAKATSGSMQDAQASVPVMANLFVKGYGLFRNFFKSDEEFLQKFIGGTATAIKLFPTVGQEMAQALKNLGPMASTLKVTMADQLTLVGMLQKIAEGSEAGTYGKAFISRLLTAGEKMKAFNGGKPLKLVDEKGQAKPLIEVLEIFKDGMQAAKQAGKADVFMKGLKEAFEDEGLKALLFLIENTEGYTRAQAELNQAMNKGVAVSHQMAAAQDDHLNAQKNLLMQTVEVVADALGKLFTPELMQGLKDMRAWVNDTLAPWIQKNPELAKGITQVGLALGGLLVTVGLVTKAFGALGLAVWANPLTWKIMAIAALVGSVVYVVYEFYRDWRAAWDRWGDYVISIVAGLTFVFNPIAGIAVAVVGFIINHWSELGAFFDSLWAEIQDRAQRFWWVIQGMGQMVLDDLQEAWSGFGEFFSGLWAEIQDRGQQVWAGIQEAGQGAFNGIKAVWSGVAGDFSSLWAEIQDRGQKVWAGIQEAGQGAFNGIKAAWSGVAGDFSGLWAEVQDRAQKVWEGTPGADQLGLDGITAAWSGLSGHLGGLWTGIQDRAQRAWWVIQGTGQMALDYLTGKWAEFSQWLDGLMAGLQEAGSRLWDGISETLETFITRAREKWDNLGELIRSLPDSLREAWDAFWTWLGQKADSVLGPLGSALRGIGDFFGFGDDEKPKAAPKPKPQSGFKQILEKKDSLSRRESEALKRLKAGNSARILDHRKGTGQATAPPTVQPTAQPAAQPTEGKLEVIIKAPKGSAQIANLEKRGGDGWNIMAGIEELWAGI